MMTTDQLTMGVLFPIEAFEGPVPRMDKNEQIALAQQAEELGFDTLWVRDVPLFDPNFRDVGQIYDPWVYMAHIATLTHKIKLGTASMVLPLRHPIHFAKSAASIDQLFPGRLHLGVASGDRAIEYPAFNKPYETRSIDFMRQIETIRTFWSEDFPHYETSFGKMQGEADVIPKPVNKRIPMYITGHAGGINLDWIAQNGDGWIYYPREFAYTKNIIQNWKTTLKKYNQPDKPYIQPLYIDLLEDPNAEPITIELGFRLGRNYLIDLLQTLKFMGVSHTIFIAKFCSRPMNEVLDEIGKEVLPYMNEG